MFLKVDIDMAILSPIFVTNIKCVFFFTYLIFNIHNYTLFLIFFFLRIFLW